MPEFVVYDPTAQGTYHPGALALRREWHAGARIGLLWNSKPNGDVLLDAVQQLLENRQRELGFVHVHKASASRAMSREDQEVLQGCDGVVNVIGD